VKKCPVCCVEENPPPSAGFAYLAALAEVSKEGLDVIVSELCDDHRPLYLQSIKMMGEETRT
jgi:hypothetical protein